MKKIAIIGAGLAGLTLAQRLAEVAQVTIFEKFIAVGGRMATRSHPTFTFDHGAQFFTVKSPEFAGFVKRLFEAGVVAHWSASFVEIDGNQINKTRLWEESFPHYVGVPNMNSVCHHLLSEVLKRNVKVCLNAHVSELNQQEDLWCLLDDSGNSLGTYDWVVTAIPAEQAFQLLPDDCLYKQAIQEIHMLPCYALMLGFTQPLDLKWDAAHVTNSALSWVSVNSTKPARGNHTSLVAMSRNDWAAENFSVSNTWVIETLMQTLSGILGEQVLNPTLVELKKWHFANAPKREALQVYIDNRNQLASCGDWCISGRVENAFLSALTLSQKMKDYL